MSYDASDPAQVKIARKAARATERQRLAGLEHLISTTQGRLWLWELISYCGPLRTAMVFGERDRTDYNLGKQDVGHRLIGELATHFPQQYVDMMNEHRRDTGRGRDSARSDDRSAAGDSGADDDIERDGEIGGESES